MELTCARLALREISSPTQRTYETKMAANAATKKAASANSNQSGSQNSCPRSSCIRLSSRYSSFGSTLRQARRHQVRVGMPQSCRKPQFTKWLGETRASTSRAERYRVSADSTARNSLSSWFRLVLSFDSMIRALSSLRFSSRLWMCSPTVLFIVAAPFFRFRQLGSLNAFVRALQKPCRTLRQ